MFFKSRDEIYLVFTDKKSKFSFYLIQYTGIFLFTKQAVKMQIPNIFENTNNFGTTLFLIALSHIHVSGAYRSRIYENVDTPRSEPYFARETYVPRTCDVPATFPWRIRDVSVFVWNFTFVCTAYQCVCATYV